MKLSNILDYIEIVHETEHGTYLSMAKQSSHNKDKFARAEKIYRQFTDLESKFYGMIERGNGSSTSEHALACLLMMNTGIRVGNEGSAEGYTTKPHPNSKAEPVFVQTYGLTTLLKEHFEATVNRKKGWCVRINFLGKKQVENYFEVDGILAEKLAILWQSVKENNVLFSSVTPYTLTKFIKRYVGKQFSPKDFRTMRANFIASNEIKEFSATSPSDKKPLMKERKLRVKNVCIKVSEHLNNTPGVCKKSYLDPRLLNLLIELQ